MPPSGLRSRNLAIGEFSPSGSSSSILVLGSVMNTVVTPCAGCATLRRHFGAQRVAIDLASALAMSRTAMATWLRRPIMHFLSLFRAPATRHHTVKTCTWHIGFLPQRRCDRSAHAAAHGFRDRVGIAAPRPRHRAEVSIDRIIDRCSTSHAPSRSRSRDADQVDLRIADQRALVVDAPAQPTRRRQSSAGARSATVRASASTSSAPSLYRRPGRHLVDDAGRPGASRTRSPLRHWITCGTPRLRASAACSARCNASPCTGIDDLRLAPSRSGPRARRGADGRRHAPARCGR